MRYWISLLLSCFVAQISFAQALEVQGRVLDFETGEPIAFARISATGQHSGTMTDIDGRFYLRSNTGFVELNFSALAYESQTLKVSLGFMTVKLHKAPLTISAISITPGENPANRIIRKAQEKSDENNPEKYSSFSYTAYNKVYATAETMLHEDSLNLPDTVKSKSKLGKILERQHLFLCESVSERTFKKPASNREIVTASRVSGLQTTTISLLSTQLQSFSFYDEQVSILGKFYVSPLSRNSETKYLFLLQDTIINGSDSTFVMSFQPKNGKTFEGLKGVLSISSRNWALTSVSAEPADSKIILPKIRQFYRLVNDNENQERWFPFQLHTDWYYLNTLAGDSTLEMKNKEVNSTPGGARLKVVSRSYLDQIEIGKEIPRGTFRGDDLKTAADATNKDEAFWQKYRQDSLSIKDRETYRRVDSLGRAEHFDRITRLMGGLATGVFPTRYFDIDLKHLLNYNFYEGLRPGFGLHTGENISRICSIGGYGAYGFRDKAFKYGADLRIHLHKPSDTWIEGKWQHDVSEAGSVNFDDDEQVVNSELYYRYYRRNFDRNDQYETRLHFRALRDLAATVRLRHSERTAGNAYQFGLVSDPVAVLINQYRFTETGAGLRFGFREKYGDLLGSRVLIESKWPVLWLDAARGFKGLLGGEYDYTRVAMKLRYEFHSKYFGQPAVLITAGWVKGNIPYSLLFGAKGTHEGKFQLSVAGSFETMSVNEFLCDKYAALYYSHTFTLFNGKKFHPDLVLRTSMLYGTLSDPGRHYNISTKSADKGYFESGILLNNLVSSGFSGFGIGAFYRYGTYARPEAKDNIVVKLSIGFAL